jgi:hypothetical protein
MVNINLAGEGEQAIISTRLQLEAEVAPGALAKRLEAD